VRTDEFPKRIMSCHDLLMAEDNVVHQEQTFLTRLRALGQKPEACTYQSGSTERRSSCWWWECPSCPSRWMSRCPLSHMHPSVAQDCYRASFSKT